MSKKHKRFISLVIATVMTLLALTPSRALATELTANSNTDISNDLQFVQHTKEYSDLLINEIRSLVYASLGNCDESIVVQQGFSIYNTDTDIVFSLMPVLLGGNYVGAIHSDDANNITFSSNTEIIEAISELSPAQHILYICNGIYYAEYEEQRVVLGSTEFGSEIGNNFISLSYIEKIDILCTKGNLQTVTFSTTQQALLTTNQSVTTLSVVPPVIDEKCSITDFVRQNADNCWAACVATIVNYKKRTNLTAQAVSNACGISGGGATLDQTHSALNRYSVYYNKLYDKLSWSKVKNTISADCPFIMGLSEFWGPHMMTGYGYRCAYTDNSTNADFRYIYAWDPNGNNICFKYNDSSIIVSAYIYTWETSLYYNP